MFENFYFIFIIGFFVGIGFLSLIIFLRKDKTDIKENTDLISLKKSYAIYSTVSSKF